MSGQRIDPHTCASTFSCVQSALVVDPMSCVIDLEANEESFSFAPSRRFIQIHQAFFLLVQVPFHCWVLFKMGKNLANLIFLYYFMG
jgi:hypothetical protein